MTARPDELYPSDWDGPIPDHPAKWSEPIKERIEAIIRPVTLGEPRLTGPLSILDPFAGPQGVHWLADDARLDCATTGVEIERKWAAAHPRTLVGDSTRLPLSWANSFDAVVTSPCYGNRMADCHEAKDGSERHTYRHKLGDVLAEGSAAGMQWGDKYRRLHADAWREVHRVLRPHGLFLLNVSNHIRDDVEQRVVEWHVGHLLAAASPVGSDGWRNDWRLDALIPIGTRRQRHGQNGEKRVSTEFLVALRRTT